MSRAIFFSRPVKSDSAPWSLALIRPRLRALPPRPATFSTPQAALCEDLHQDAPEGSLVSVPLPAQKDNPFNFANCRERARELGRKGAQTANQRFRVNVAALRKQLAQEQRERALENALQFLHGEIQRIKGKMHRCQTPGGVTAWIKVLERAVKLSVELGALDSERGKKNPASDADRVDSLALLRESQSEPQPIVQAENAQPITQSVNSQAVDHQA